MSGVVVSAGASAFTLDYGNGTVLVEMDDWDWYGDAYGLLEGDRVTVYGRVDDDFFEVAKIEAGSVYVEALNTYYYASASDEEGAAYEIVATPDDDSIVHYTGTVSGVDGREFTLDTGTREVRVDTSEMVYNPMDDKGYQKVEEGDFVRVGGAFEDNFFEARELTAQSVMTLVNEMDES
jgi:uncharacterized protein YdeI (BOF family)